MRLISNNLSHFRRRDNVRGLSAASVTTRAILEAIFFSASKESSSSAGPQSIPRKVRMPIDESMFFPSKH